MCLFVSPSLHLLRFGKLVRYADKKTLPIVKVYIERYNLQFKVMPICDNKKLTLLTFTFAKRGFNAISPTERKSRQWLSDCAYCHWIQWVYTYTSRWSLLANFVGHSLGVLSFFFLLSCSPNYAITLCKINVLSNTMKVYNERNRLQLELILYSKHILTLFTFTFAKRRIRPPNA